MHLKSGLIIGVSSLREILVFYYLSQLSASEIWPDKRGVLSQGDITLLVFYYLSQLSASEIWPDKRGVLSQGDISILLSQSA